MDALSRNRLPKPVPELSDYTLSQTTRRWNLRAIKDLPRPVRMLDQLCYAGRKQAL